MKRALLIKQFDRKLEQIIGVDLPILKKVKKFVISSGGKRIRPLTHYYFAQILDYRGDEWKDVGAIGELIHAASLLHDDVVDNSVLRRGKPTINKIYDNKTAVLSGDFLLACGLEHLSTLEHAQRLLGVFTRVIRMLAVGELLQMQWETNFKIPEKVYERIIQGKTAGLFGAMTESAAILAGYPEQEILNYRDFGEKLGRIFQIRDDYLDYFGSEEINGKDLYQDFRRGLVTRPVIVLRSRLKGKDKKWLEQTWVAEERRESRENIEILTSLVEKDQLERHLSQEIEAEIDSLIQFLGKYPASDSSNEIQNRLRELMV